MYPPADPNDPNKPKKPPSLPGPTLDGNPNGGSPFSASLPGTMVNDYGLGDPAAPPPPIGNPQFPLGDPNAPPPPVSPNVPPLGNGQNPGSGVPVGTVPAAPAAPALGGSADFPSLPPGATPPPGYVDPVTGKTAPAAAPAGAPASPAAPAATPGAPAAPASPTAPGAAPAAPGQPSPTDAYHKALIDGLTRGAPTLDDPALKAQTDAFAVQQQRAKERARESLAERSAASGQSSDLASSGAFDQGLVGLEQQQGEAQGAYNANLLGTATQQQRDELLHWAQLAGIDENSEEGRQLQQRLAELDAQIKREQIASGEKLGTADIATRNRGIDTQGRLGEGGLNNDLLRILLQNEQFGKGLGADLGKFGATRDDANFWRSLGLI